MTKIHFTTERDTLYMGIIDSAKTLCGREWTPNNNIQLGIIDNVTCRHCKRILIKRLLDTEEDYMMVYEEVMKGDAKND